MTARLLGVVEVGTGCDYCEALTEMAVSTDTDLSLHQRWTSFVHHEPGCWPATFADTIEAVLCGTGVTP